MKLVVLVENMATGRGIRGEHGLSFWLESRGRSILFDVGQTDIFAWNARILGVPWEAAEGILLSHGHYDHTGGLSLALKPGMTVFAHPDAWAPHRSRGRGRLSDIACPVSREFVEARASIRELKTPTEVLPGVWFSGEIPRLHSFEREGTNFYLDLPGRPPDPLLDDAALFLCQEGGLDVVLGCAHAGVANTLSYARALFERPIRTVIGGMHLVGAPPERVEATLEALQGVERVVAGHCTGWKAAHRLQEGLGDRFGLLHAGQQFAL
ncbi:MAG: MBL fold metallo-hydrolase [Bacteroidota bacterium]